MPHLKALRSCANLHDVAALLGYKAKTLSYLVYIRPEANKYVQFSIPKKGGGERNICAPARELKLLQRRVADVLQNCIDEIEGQRSSDDALAKKDSVSHGFVRRRSIITNAAMHRNKRFVFNVDLQDFFGSINFGRVRGFFMRNKHFELCPDVATVLAQACCFQNSLPQGAPSSPIISNLIGRILDIRLLRLAMREGCVYTRYADDLTFSTSKNNFPTSIGRRDLTHEHIWVAGETLVSEIASSGFELNPIKTRMQYKGSRQDVTGLVVNKKVNIPATYRHTVRAMVHRLVRTGSFEVQVAVDEFGRPEFEVGRIDQLHGMLGYIDLIDRYNISRNRASGDELGAKEKIYRKFLMYKEFFAAPRPVLITEGKTDPIYITQAIRNLWNHYPALAEVDADGEVKIKIRRFRYTESSTGRILGLKDGGDSIKHFIRHFDEECSSFNAPGGGQPVIVLVDNDEGANGVCGVVKGILKQKTQIDRTAPFIRVTRNLYLIFTPLVAGKATSMIEDFFEKSVLEIKVDGKAFEPATANFDKTIHFGKAVFAHKVVKQQAKSIDFSGFTGILDRIGKVILYHQKLHDQQ